MTKQIRKYCAFFFIFVITASSFGESLQKIKLATVENLPPFSFYENDKLIGIDIEVIKDIAKRARINIEIQTLPWARVIASLQTGIIDGAFSVYENEDRKRFCTFVDVMHYDNLGMVVLKGKEFSYSGIKDLYNKKIGKGAGVFISTDFENATISKKIVVEEINDTEMSNIKKLYIKRIDVVIGVVETMLYYSKKLGFSGDIVSIPNLIEANRSGYLVFSNKSSLVNNVALLSSIKSEIKNMMHDGTYERIVRKYVNYSEK